MTYGCNLSNWRTEERVAMSLRPGWIPQGGLAYPGLQIKKKIERRKGRGKKEEKTYLIKTKVY